MHIERVQEDWVGAGEYVCSGGRLLVLVYAVAARCLVITRATGRREGQDTGLGIINGR